MRMDFFFPHATFFYHIGHADPFEKGYGKRAVGISQKEIQGNHGSLYVVYLVLFNCHCVSGGKKSDVIFHYP